MIKSTFRAALIASVLLTPIAAEAQQYRANERDHARSRHESRGPIAADAHHHRANDRDNVRSRHEPGGPQYRNWRRGDRFEARYARNYGSIDYRRYRGLRPPPRGYRYVRSGNDAVLVGITTGIVAAVIANAIR